MGEKHSIQSTITLKLILVNKQILTIASAAFVVFGCTNASVEVGDTQITIQEEKEPLKIYINQIDVVAFQQTTPEGAGWDPLDNSAPDIKVEVRVNDNVAYTSDPFENAINTKEYRFIPDVPITINPKANVSINLYDEEFWVEPTHMGGWQTGAIWSEFLKGRNYPESVILGGSPLGFRIFLGYEK